MSGVIAPFVATVALVTYRSVAGKGTTRPPLGGAPLPADYAAATLTFGVLGVIDHAGGNASTIASLLGWGFTAAVALNLFARPQAGAAAGAALQAQAQKTNQATTASLGAAPTG